MAKKNKPTKAKKAKAAVGVQPAKNKTTRAERFDAARKQRNRRRLVRNIITIAIIVIPLGGLITWGAVNFAGTRLAIRDMNKGACNHDTKMDPGSVDQITSTAAYGVNPPSGGARESAITSPGAYSGSSAPADGQIVHALGHGDVAVWFKPDIAPDDLQKLKDFQAAHTGDVLLIPRGSMTPPVAATAWGHRLLCDQLEMPAIQKFRSTFVNKGPEKVDHT